MVHGGKKASETEEERKEKLHVYTNQMQKKKKEKQNHFLIDLLFANFEVKHLLLSY